MKKLLSLALLCFYLSLTACQSTNPDPQVFGMPQSQFNRLTKDQQDEVITAYNKRKQTEEQNKPITDAIGAVVPAINASKFKAPSINNIVSPPSFNNFDMKQPSMPSIPTAPPCNNCTTQNGVTHCECHTHTTSTSVETHIDPAGIATAVLNSGMLNNLTH